MRFLLKSSLIRTYLNPESSLAGLQGTVCKHLRVQLLDLNEQLFKLHKQSAVYQNNSVAGTYIGTGALLIVAMRHGLNAQNVYPQN